jgi:lipopolysaccharide biosynthesis regulator YciM
MEFDILWALLALPAFFGLGWLASRMDLRQLRLENRQAPKAYFKGLNYLLNEQQDQAIDAFIEAVQKDPDTSELHFALGNLFRRRGEYDRAVRVHQHLLSRADLQQADRDRAQYALALDYLKAGLLDHAEQALLKLEGSAFEEQAFLALLANYERSRDWHLAADIATKLDTAQAGSFANRLAHYQCEQALSLAAKGNSQAAIEQLEAAIAKGPNAPRPRMELAKLQAAQGQTDAAFDTLRQALQACPQACPLIATPLAQLATQTGRITQVREQLQSLYERQPALDLLEAIVALAKQEEQPDTPARDWYARHLESETSLVAASKWLALEKLEHEQFHPQLQRALDAAAKPLLRYRCAACGFEASQYFWQCPGCQGWDTYPAKRVEEL